MLQPILDVVLLLLLLLLQLLQLLLLLLHLVMMLLPLVVLQLDAFHFLLQLLQCWWMGSFLLLLLAWPRGGDIWDECIRVTG
jgi:hypothetical protein